MRPNEVQHTYYVPTGSRWTVKDVIERLRENFAPEDTVLRLTGIEHSGLGSNQLVVRVETAHLAEGQASGRHFRQDSCQD